MDFATYDRQLTKSGSFTVKVSHDKPSSPTTESPTVSHFLVNEMNQSMRIL